MSLHTLDKDSVLFIRKFIGQSNNNVHQKLTNLTITEIDKACDEVFKQGNIAKYEKSAVIFLFETEVLWSIYEMITHELYGHLIINELELLSYKEFSKFIVDNDFVIADVIEKIKIALKM